MTNPQQQTFLSGPARARRGDPETSHEAAASTSTTELQSAILDALRFGPAPDGKIRERIELRQRHSLGESSVRSRRAELVRLGRVEFAGVWAETRTGQKCRVWKLSSPR